MSKPSDLVQGTLDLLLLKILALVSASIVAFRAMGRISGVFLLVLGVGTFAAAKGLLQRRRWAWWFAVVLFGVNGLGDVVSFIMTGDWLRSASGILISFVFIWALTRTDVRRSVRD